MTNTPTPPIDDLFAQCAHDHMIRTQHLTRIQNAIDDTFIRELLIDPETAYDDIIDSNYDDDDMIPTRPYFARCADSIRYLLNDPFATDDLTNLLLSLSLCPMHRIDYAICFDDESPECAAIRMIHPNHDT